jgi:2-oxoglutarate ferredoxin oxidoreductase subunit alpha
MGETDWALTGCEGRERRIVNSLYLSPEKLNEMNLKLKRKYDLIRESEQRFEIYNADDPYELLLTAFGTMARICKSAIDELKAEGRNVALFRPITVDPYPYGALREAMDRLPPDAKVFDVEMNMGQMLEDVRLAAEGTRQIFFHGTAGGIVPSPDDVAQKIRKILEGEDPGGP